MIKTVTSVLVDWLSLLGGLANGGELNLVFRRLYLKKKTEKYDMINKYYKKVKKKKNYLSEDFPEIIGCLTLHISKNWNLLNIELHSYIVSSLNYHSFDFKNTREQGIGIIQENGYD